MSGGQYSEPSLSRRAEDKQRKTAEASSSSWKVGNSLGNPWRSTAVGNRCVGKAQRNHHLCVILTVKSGDLRDENHKKVLAVRKSRQLSRKFDQRWVVFHWIARADHSGSLGFRRTALTESGVIARIRGMGHPVVQRVQSEKQSQGAGQSWCSTVLRAKTHL